MNEEYLGGTATPPVRSALDCDTGTRTGTVLVTGGAGFLGSHLVTALVPRSERVVVVDDLSQGRLTNLGPTRNHVEHVQLDVCGDSFLDLVATRRFTAIFHLAGNSYVPPSVTHPAFDFNANLVSTFQLLECLRQHSPETHLLYASSAAVYGNPDSSPINEATALAPISPYGASKLAAEQYVKVYANTYDMHTASLRYFSMYGPRQRKQVVFDILQKLHANPCRLELFGTGEELRDLTYVTDAVEATLTVAYYGGKRGAVYNIASGSSKMIRDVAGTVCHALGVSPVVAFTGSLRPGDPDRWVADPSQLFSLGFRPRTSFPSGIAAVVDWFREQEAEGAP